MVEKFKEFMRFERGGRRHFDDMDPWTMNIPVEEETMKMLTSAE